MWSTPRHIAGAALIAVTSFAGVNAQENPLERKKSRLEMIADGSLTPCMAYRGRDVEKCRDLERMAENTVTAEQVRSVMDDVRRAEPTLRAIWTETFRLAGRTFVMPTIRYYGTFDGLPGLAQPPGCPFHLDNALYCPVGGGIYYDVVFLAKVKAVVSRQQNSSGQFAALAVVAHELGHAVRHQTGGLKGDGTDDHPLEELLADCFSGAAISALNVFGRNLPPNTNILAGWTPLAEGQLAMFFSGGTETSPQGHADGPTRRAKFTLGFSDGVKACTPANMQ